MYVFSNIFNASKYYIWKIKKITTLLKYLFLFKLYNKTKSIFEISNNFKTHYLIWVFIIILEILKS